MDYLKQHADVLRKIAEGKIKKAMPNINSEYIDIVSDLHNGNMIECIAFRGLSETSFDDIRITMYGREYLEKVIEKIERESLRYRIKQALIWIVIAIVSSGITAGMTYLAAC